MSIFLFLLQQYILSFLNKNVNFLYFYLENAYLDISQLVVLVNFKISQIISQYDLFDSQL